MVTQYLSASARGRDEELGQAAKEKINKCLFRPSSYLNRGESLSQSNKRENSAKAVALSRELPDSLMSESAQRHFHFVCKFKNYKAFPNALT